MPSEIERLLQPITCSSREPHRDVEAHRGWRSYIADQLAGFEEWSSNIGLGFA